jgi:ADP-heptose:LPS heptosyltransferase
MSERGSPTLRTLDRYAGIPVVAAAGLVRRRRKPPSEIVRVGLLKAYAIGDTVLLSAIVRDLAAALPDAEIVFFSGLDNATTAELIDGVSDVVSVPISRPWLTVRRLREARVDVLLDFGAWPRIEALETALSGARYTVGFRTPGQFRHYAYDTAVPHSAVVHELENYRRILEPIGVESRSLPRLEPPGEPASDALPDGDYVVFHLWPGGYRSELKEWPLERWRELAEALSGQGFAVVLTGGRDDAERTAAFARSCGSLPRPVVGTAGRLTIREVLDVLARSRGVVSVNTGTMHLAAAVGAPTVALNGPTDERRWGPLGERALSVNSAYEGCGYLNLGSEYDGRREDCMLGISVERVLEATGTLAGFAAREPA